MVAAVTMNNRRMGVTVALADRAIGQGCYHEARVRPRKGKFAAAGGASPPTDGLSQQRAGDYSRSAYQ